MALVLTNEHLPDRARSAQQESSFPLGEKDLRILRIPISFLTPLFFPQGTEQHSSGGLMNGAISVIPTG